MKVRMNPNGLGGNQLPVAKQESCQALFGHRKLRQGLRLIKSKPSRVCCDFEKTTFPVAEFVQSRAALSRVFSPGRRGTAMFESDCWLDWDPDPERAAREADPNLEPYAS